MTINDRMLDKVLNKTKEKIDIEKFDTTKIVIDADNKLPHDITLKINVILMTCVTKDDGKFYPQLLLEEALFLK